MRERIAVFLDLENLVRAEGGLDGLTRYLDDLRARGTVVASIACCACAVARRLAFTLRDVRVRVFLHQGGPDAADLELIERIRAQVPSTVDTVVIGSGDHIFAQVARELRARGKRVEAVARPGTIATTLYRAVDECRLLPGEARSA